MDMKFVQIKYLQSQYNGKVWCSPFEIRPLLLVLAVRKAEYDALYLENNIPKSSSDWGKKGM